MVVIRLSRGGAKKRPFYHVVVSDKRSARDGRCVERIGYFNPIAAGKDIKLELNLERALYWISTGAQPSDRVRRLIKLYEEQAKEKTKQ
jgi:small subunit ribosomal protein S16